MFIVKTDDKIRHQLSVVNQLVQNGQKDIIPGWIFGVLMGIRRIAVTGISQEGKKRLERGTS